MYYVQRNAQGVIVGLYANPQPQESGPPLTDAEPLAEDHPDVVAFLTPAPNAVIDAQIAALEQGQLLPRGVREYIMAGMVEKGASLGLTEPQLYAAQVGYRRLKDFDAQIKALRAQRKP